jgi:DNA topoisomerase-1
MKHIHLHIHRTHDAGYKPSEARAKGGKWTAGGGTAPTGTTTATRARKAAFTSNPRKTPPTPKATSPTPTPSIAPKKAAPVGGGTFNLPGTNPAKPAVPTKAKSTNGMLPAPQDKTQWPEHLRKLRVPPAWTDVRIHPDQKHNLWVTGRDVKGRVQSLYSPDFSKQNSAKKFSRVTNLAKNLDKIAAKNNKNWNARDEGTKEHAQLLGLMIATGIRPGSERDTGAEKQAYGATTLQGQHIITDKAGNVRLRFVGKKGKDLDLPVEDTAIAKMLQHRAVEAGPNGKIFPRTTDSSLRRYVSVITNGQAKPKDFRTLVGTSTAMKIMQTMNAPTNEKEYKKATMAVAKQVAQKLGNTATIALNSYISPQVFDGWKIKA